MLQKETFFIVVITVANKLWLTALKSRTISLNAAKSVNVSRISNISPSNSSFLSLEKNWCWNSCFGLTGHLTPFLFIISILSFNFLKNRLNPPVFHSLVN